MKLAKINTKIKLLEESLMVLQTKGKELVNNLDLLQKEYDRDQTEYDKLEQDLEKDPVFKKLNDEYRKINNALKNKQRNSGCLFLFISAFLVINYFVSEAGLISTALLFISSLGFFITYAGFALRNLERKLKDKAIEIRKYRKSKRPSFKEITKTTLNESEKIISLKSNEIKKIQNEIEKTEQKLKSNISLKRFNKKYDKDDNQILDVIQTSKVEKIILHQQNEIRLIEKKENRNYINDLFKISSFLSSYEQMLQLEFKDIQKLGDNEWINEEIKAFDTYYENYQTLHKCLFLMITSLMQDNLFIYLL